MAEMRLSEAIRKGARKRPKAEGVFFKRVGKNRTLCSCTLGAAYEGATGEVLVSKPKKVYAKLVNLFPELNSTVPEGYLGDKPTNSKARWKLGALITVTSDCRGATREQIAGWLEAKGY